MCFWSEIAFFNCDGTVERQKHLCGHAVNNSHGAGVEICKDYDTPSGCKHSETTRAIPDRAIYRHVCDRDAYRPPARSGVQYKFIPSIKEDESADGSGRRENGCTLKCGVHFRWCDGSLSTLEDKFHTDAGPFNWRPVDLLTVDEGKRIMLLGKGRYEHWVEVWSGIAEKE